MNFFLIECNFNIDMLLFSMKNNLTLNHFKFVLFIEYYLIVYTFSQDVDQKEAQETEDDVVSDCKVEDITKTEDSNREAEIKSEGVPKVEQCKIQESADEEQLRSQSKRGRKRKTQVRFSPSPTPEETQPEPVDEEMAVKTPPRRKVGRPPKQKPMLENPEKSAEIKPGKRKRQDSSHRFNDVDSMEVPDGPSERKKIKTESLVKAGKLSLAKQDTFVDEINTKDQKRIEDSPSKSKANTKSVSTDEISIKSKPIKQQTSVDESKQKSNSRQLSDDTGRPKTTKSKSDLNQESSPKSRTNLKNLASDLSCRLKPTGVSYDEPTKKSKVGTRQQQREETPTKAKANGKLGEDQTTGDTDEVSSLKRSRKLELGSPVRNVRRKSSLRESRLSQTVVG